jgi:hypothetical protein
MKRMSLLGQVLCLLLEWLITIKLSCKGVWNFRYDKISCHTKLKVKITFLTAIGLGADILQGTLVQDIDMLTAHAFNFR